MKISLGDVKAQLEKSVAEYVASTNSTAKTCAVQASKELRNAAMIVLGGKRNGRVYRVPGTKKATYHASAPGEPPAVRTGTLRESWQMAASYDVDIRLNLKATAEIYSDVPYAEPLEEGHGTVDRRPYRERTIERAKPRIVRTFRRMMNGRN